MASKKTLSITELVVAMDTWFNTGDMIRDLGYCHAQFVDRLGDTFRWKGENVSTVELEAIINNLPNIAHSAVYGVVLPYTDGKVSWDLSENQIINKPPLSLPKHKVHIPARHTVDY